jgi:hypothetical protein
MTYEVKPGISKNISTAVTCSDCFQPMHSIYDRAIRETCTPCGGVAKRDSVMDLRERRLARERRKKVDRENARLLKEHR